MLKGGDHVGCHKLNKSFQSEIYCYVIKYGSDDIAWQTRIVLVTLLNVERSSDRKNESGVFLSYLFFTPCKHVVCCKVLKTKAKRLQTCIKGEVKRSASI